MSEDKTDRGAGFDSIVEPDPRFDQIDWTKNSDSITIANLTEDEQGITDEDKDEEEKR
ncbi:hypothetical protein [Paenibacillus gallinarum]|uniref:DUF4025 domain-containing protein n=1 Tax=Paenibacillus gallinarum TaxID=2762232 RepID=A0ABR8SY65_9BACL|nr:hypothetical protein [Paenibacillus gallinarum]MBD7968340.1 hypothetical protein [Paenibacillus gallinarum]